MMQFKLFVPVVDSCVKKICLFLQLLLICSAATSRGISFNDSIAIITDNRSPELVIQKLHLATIHFLKQSNNRVDIGLVGNDYHYFLLKLSASDSLLQPLYLSIDNTSLDSLQIYTMTGNGTAKLLYEGGSTIAFNTSRNYVWHTAPLAIGPQPSYYLVAIKAGYKNLNVRYDIIEPDALQQQYAIYQRYVFFYMGIVSMIAFVMLIAVLLFKKAVFGAYLGYTICAGGWILTHYGCIFPLLYPNMPMINAIVKPITSLGASLFLMMVLLQVFQNNLLTKPWLQQILKAAVYVVAILMASMLSLLIPHLNGSAYTLLVAAWQVALICSIGIIVLTPICFIRTGYTAKLFTAAVLTICVMAIVQQVANLGYIKSFFINEHGITIASLLEIFIMAFGLFYNFYQEKKAKEKQVIELEKERTETLKKLITVQNNERKRIASDLHDNLGPLLAALKINFRRIMNSKDSLHQNLVEKTEGIIDDSIAEIRNVAHNLMPKGLSANGLINTLNEYFEGIEQLYNKKLLFRHRIDASLTHELQTNLYRIVCELVLNAARHSQAETINVQIQTTSTIITISIYDDGQGFIRKLNGQTNTLGLQSAESRVLYMKGAFNLQSEKGRGTLIDIQIPL
jgi:signal transduction histidine kinase